MLLQRTILIAAAATALVSTATAQTFRLGDEPYRFVEDAPGHAYTRQAPTMNAYFRPTPTGDDQIGRLSSDLDHQLKMSYRHDVPEYNKRYVHYRAVMDEWDKSPKGVDETRQMTQWLRTSIKYSMPGSDDFLPPMPKMNPVWLDGDSTREKSVGDPFTDDPVQTAPM